MAQHYSYKGMTESAMRFAGVVAREREFAATDGHLAVMDEAEQIVINRTADGAIVIGTGELAEALAAALVAKYAGSYRVADGSIVYYNDAWTDDDAKVLIDVVLFA